MNTKEFAKHIINLEYLHDIPIEIGKYFDDIEYLFLKKDFDIIKPSEEKKEEILITFFQFFPDINKKDINFVTNYKNFNYISYSDLENENNLVFFNKEIFLIRKQDFFKSYNFTFLPIKKNIHLKYKFDENNPHLNIDNKIKLNTSPKYKKTNHLIYLLQKIIQFCRTKNYYYINHKPYENLLYKVYAMVLLNKTEPIKCIKEDIDLIKQKIIFNNLNSKELKEYFMIIES